MEIQFDYTRPRREFGQHPRFSWQVSEDVQKANSITAKPEEAATWASRWVERMVSTVELDCTPVMAQHQVNTEQFTQASKGTLHTEGAWPNDVKLNDPQDKVRLLRRYKNEASYQQAVPNLVRVAETAVLHNNAIDLYEEYFTQGDNDSFQYEPPSCKTAAVFRDPSVKDGNNQLKRAATRISWHPDGSPKLAVSYSVLQFQAMPANLPLSSYIWDVNNPNQPDAEIMPQSPLSCLVYNPKSPDHLVGGSYNGLIGFWDLRKGSMPVENSLIEKSHKDPVYDVHWIQSRTGNECCSVSTDGQVLWWDIRKLAGGPTDNLVLTSEEKSQTSLYGGTCMEYKSDAGATRYLVGTEQGVVLLLDRKPKKDAESQKQVKMLFGAQSGKHYGRIYSVQRNPVHSKYFLTIGDWTARVWMEDLKAPIMTTKFDSAYLTGGCWSATRPGLFFTTKVDGTMDVWDFFHKQNDCIFSTKVSDAGLSSIRAHQNGKLVALGSMDGSCTVLELSDALSELQKDEKAAMGQIFEREQKREKNLELRSIQRKKEKKEEKGKAEGQAPQKLKLVVSKENDEVDVDKLIKQAEENFFKAMQSQEEPEKVKADSSSDPAGDASESASSS